MSCCSRSDTFGHNFSFWNWSVTLSPLICTFHCEYFSLSKSFDYFLPLLLLIGKMCSMTCSTFYSSNVIKYFDNQCQIKRIKSKIANTKQKPPSCTSVWWPLLKIHQQLLYHWATAAPSSQHQPPQFLSMQNAIAPSSVSTDKTKAV